MNLILEGQHKPDEVWLVIWKAKIPLKIKYHVWRCLMDTLPCSANLQKRHVLDNANCPIYGNSNETVQHVLLECENARQCWLRSSIGWQG